MTGTATISYNLELSNYIVTFANGKSINCANYRTALYYYNRGC